MKNSVIQDQVNAIVRVQTCNERRKNALHAAWDALESFLSQHAALPERLQDIAPGHLTGFVTHCYQCGAIEESLHMMLGALRTLLKEAGQPAASLANLTAPARPERISNDANGNYQRRQRFIDPASWQPSAISFPGE